jgi:hypothetical protein
MLTINLKISDGIVYGPDVARKVRRTANCNLWSRLAGRQEGNGDASSGLPELLWVGDGSEAKYRPVERGPWAVEQAGSSSERNLR